MKVHVEKLEGCSGEYGISLDSDKLLRRYQQNMIEKRYQQNWWENSRSSCWFFSRDYEYQKKCSLFHGFHKFIEDIFLSTTHFCLFHFQKKSISDFLNCQELVWGLHFYPLVNFHSDAIRLPLTFPKTPEADIWATICTRARLAFELTDALRSENTTKNEKRGLKSERDLTCIYAVLRV